MDHKSNHASPVLTVTLGLRSNLLTRPAPSPALTSELYLVVPRKKTGRYSGDLDAMKSSSAPPKMITISEDIAYQTWMLKYPSALLPLEQFANFAKGKRIALFLDYDGTFSPIVDNPHCAFMTDPMQAAVRKAAQCFPTAIINGRSHDKVFEFVQRNELYYAGSHGMDIIGPVLDSSSEDGPNLTKSADEQYKKVSLFQLATEFLNMIKEVLVLLIETTKNIDGVKVENNKFCVSVHNRNVDEDVLEVRPGINWDKGRAVMFLPESIGLRKCDDVLPIYIGDDRTDEDAFKVSKTLFELIAPKDGHGSSFVVDIL